MDQIVEWPGPSVSAAPLGGRSDHARWPLDWHREFKDKIKTTEDVLKKLDRLEVSPRSVPGATVPLLTKKSLLGMFK